MIYVVSGMIRSGTSMMMRALKKGGMDIYWDGQHEKNLRGKYPKERNPGGYWEPSPDEREHHDFPLQVPEGMVVKICAPWLRLGIMPPAEYRILLIRRDPHEIGASIVQLLKAPLSREDQHNLANYDALMDKSAAVSRNRKDVLSVHVLDYNNVLLNPRQSFQSLLPDWPIDEAKAASVIKPKLRTCRKVA